MAAVLDTRSEAETLVLDHRGLARHLAHRYARAADQREDLEQVAYLGLVKAAQRFDRARGVAFTTFATPTILGELRRYCRDTRWAAHVPRPMQESVQALRRFEDDYVGHSGHSPSTSEAADALGWTHEQVLEARMAAGCLRPQSLNALLQAADGTVGEAIDTFGAEDSAFAETERRDELRRALSYLNRRERRALHMRAELDCSAPEIGRRLGISPSQASRLVARATAHLRAVLVA
ncbi:MAG TPA: sigma-70 family RNA polymerase sigma factor [Solirubrobacter sp.]|nr:sigma-70 family RNA polymerase sigma factor [Solirubrobacter sp.]